MSWLQANIEGWDTNPDAYLPDEGYWPIENVYVPSLENNPIYDETVEDYRQETKPAVIGKTGRYEPTGDFWRKLVPEMPINSEYSLLFVEDGVHRVTAAVNNGEKWIRATMQASPGTSFEGGHEMKPMASNFPRKNWLTRTADGTLDDMFNTPPRKVIRKDPPTQKTVTLELYRGFDADLQALTQSGDGYILSPEKCEQGVLWFSQKIADAEHRGKWLLAYPLDAIRHYQRFHLEDGDYYDDIPEEIRAACEPTENCRFYGGIELPEGWYFSYKVEKHIVCSVPIQISRDMLKEVG